MLPLTADSAAFFLLMRPLTVDLASFLLLMSPLIADSAVFLLLMTHLIRDLNGFLLLLLLLIDDSAASFPTSAAPSCRLSCLVAAFASSLRHRLPLAFHNYL